jgi:hypothetical protein
MYRSEVKLRTNILGEPAKHIRPLSETRCVSFCSLFSRIDALFFFLFYLVLSAIENGANALAEGFLVSVAAVLILGETYRSSRSQSKRRDAVDDTLDGLHAQIADLSAKVDSIAGSVEERVRGLEERCVASSVLRSYLSYYFNSPFFRTRNEDLTRLTQRIVEFGLRGGWAEFEGTPLQLPRLQIVPPERSIRIEPPDSNDKDKGGKS